MWIRTNEDRVVAIARLSRRSPESLAAFIASLAHDTGPVGEHVRTFIDADDPAAIVASIEERIDALRPSSRRASRDRAGDDVGQRFEFLVADIETLVLPSDRQSAFRLLVRLIERDGDGLEACDDEGWTVTTAISRACDLVVRAGAALPPDAVLTKLRGLVAGDAYGTRKVLAALVEALAASR
jgi:hypothetical protein